MFDRNGCKHHTKKHPVLTFMKWFGLAALLGCNSNNIVRKGSLASGPFEISWAVVESRSGAWFNNGGNFNAKQYTAWFSVQHAGKRVQVPAFDPYWGSPSAGTAPDKPVEQFWQALFLKDAPKPAVLTGLHSIHLITEENGQVRVRPLHEQGDGFATYQWLDSENGQPGAANNVYLGDDSGNSRFLSGGRYLMVNSKVVLDVQTLEIFPFDTHTYGESQAKLQGYNATNMPVVQFSPLKTQMVLVGNRDNPENRLLYQYALVVLDFKKNQGYAVPFDRTDTRFFSVWDATTDWLQTYFQWRTNQAGVEQLTLRKFERLPYWQGRWDYDESTGAVVQYKLMPVKASMFPIFMAFIRKEIAIQSEETEKTPAMDNASNGEPLGDYISTFLQTADGSLQIYWNPMEAFVSLQSSNPDLIKKIGTHFNEEMGKGAFQEHFGRYE